MSLATLNVSVFSPERYSRAVISGLCSVGSLSINMSFHLFQVLLCPWVVVSFQVPFCTLACVFTLIFFSEYCTLHLSPSPASLLKSLACVFTLIFFRNIVHFTYFPRLRLSFFLSFPLSSNCFVIPLYLFFHQVLSQWIIDQPPLGHKAPIQGEGGCRERLECCPACRGLLPAPVLLSSRHALLHF